MITGCRTQKSSTRLFPQKMIKNVKKKKGEKMLLDPKERYTLRQGIEHMDRTGQFLATLFHSRRLGMTPLHSGGMQSLRFPRKQLYTSAKLAYCHSLSSRCHGLLNMFKAGGVTFGNSGVPHELFFKSSRKRENPGFSVKTRFFPYDHG